MSPLQNTTSKAVCNSTDVFSLARIACELEVHSIKAGNIHPQACFVDTDIRDFIQSAAVMQACWSAVPSASVGTWVLSAVRETRRCVGKNTNLGIVLLLAPIVKAAWILQSETPPPIDHLPFPSLPTHQVLGGLTPKDSADIYKAIGMAKPGGLGSSDRHDVSGPAPQDLLIAMQIAAVHDDVAKQYVTNFADVYTLGQQLAELCHDRFELLDAISHLQIVRMANCIDTLIARKCGKNIAENVRAMAKKVFSSGEFNTTNYKLHWKELDTFLRSDKNRLNPGTTADLIAAAIFVCLLHNPSILQKLNHG